MTRKIIIDTDPGIDDAMAIAFAYTASDIELLALTTIFGNVSVERATQNAIILRDLMSLDIPVAKGCSKPLVKDLRPFPAMVHGQNGLGDIPLPPPDSDPTGLDAVSLMIELVNSHPDEVTIVAIGPLTNLAMAIQRDPTFYQNVREIVLMGGAAKTNGNVTPAAEANIFCDPHAADIVFTTDWPVTMVGLDVTHQTIMTDGYLRQVHKNGKPLGEFIYDISRYYLNYHRETNIDGLYTHDPSTIAYLIAPDLFTTQKGEVRVCTDGISAGQTIMNYGKHVYRDTPWNDIPQTNVCLNVHTEGLLRLYAMIMSGW